MNRRGSMPAKQPCLGINKESGLQCTAPARPGRSLCGRHDTDEVNLIPGYVNAPRAQQLSRFLGGDEFEAMANDAEAIRDFNTDYAIFRKRELELAARFQQNDSPSFRQDILEMLLALRGSLTEETKQSAPYLETKIDEIVEFAGNFAELDETWDTLLEHTERGVKLKSTAMNAITKERNSFTIPDLLKVILKIFTILESDYGADRAARTADRIEREIIAPLGGVAESQRAEIISASALGPGDS